MTSHVQLVQILSKIDSLPELPQVALRLTQLLDDPNVSAEKLGEVITSNDSNSARQGKARCKQQARKSANSTQYFWGMACLTL